MSKNSTKARYEQLMSWLPKKVAKPTRTNDRNEGKAPSQIDYIGIKIRNGKR